MYIEGGFFVYIKNGIIMDDSIRGVKVKKMIVPRVTGKHRPGIKRKPRSITIHNTSNNRRGADAIAHGHYLKNLEKNPITSQVSWNFVVDRDRIVQCIPIDEISFCQGHSRGNRESISIEICDCYPINSRDYKKSEDNAIKLAGEILRYYKFNKSNIFKHQDWSGKYCPARILKKNRWEEVKGRIYKESLNTENIPERVKRRRNLNLIVYGTDKSEMLAAFRLGKVLKSPVVPATWNIDFKPYYTLGYNIVAVGDSVLHTSYRTHELKDVEKVGEFIKSMDNFKAN